MTSHKPSQKTRRNLTVICSLSVTFCNSVSAFCCLFGVGWHDHEYGWSGLSATGELLAGTGETLGAIVKCDPGIGYVGSRRSGDAPYRVFGGNRLATGDDAAAKGAGPPWVRGRGRALGMGGPGSRAEKSRYAEYSIMPSCWRVSSKRPANCHFSLCSTRHNSRASSLVNSRRISA